MMIEKWGHVAILPNPEDDPVFRRSAYKRAVEDAVHEMLSRNPGRKIVDGSYRTQVTEVQWVELGDDSMLNGDWLDETAFKHLAPAGAEWNPQNVRVMMTWELE